MIKARREVREGKRRAINVDQTGMLLLSVVPSPGKISLDHLTRQPSISCV
jgi:hypothetical protein